MTANEIRTRYLEFFNKNGHTIIPSSPLVPENDPSTLFTGSGMQPIVPYLLGAKHPSGNRVANSQKCFRSQDIEEVGDNRHTTFFEMLGNWSFGDYFKKEQIRFMWTFLTEELALNPKNIYFTCFKGNENLAIPKDTESALLWQSLYQEKGLTVAIGENPEVDGIQDGEHIFYYDEKKNWWSRAGVPHNMPVGEPGGPDTEMFWDFGLERGLHEVSPWKDTPCHVNCDCGRFLEIGNNVFMEYKRAENDFVLLSQRNVDFGGGLERLMAAAQNEPDIFKGDIFTHLRTHIENLSQKVYGRDETLTYAFRVLMDHMRASVFLIADGVTPSNTDQGYVLRRLLRRAIRYADILGIESLKLSSCVLPIVSTYHQVYPILREKQSFIEGEINGEETKFRQTLSRGVKELEKRAQRNKGLTDEDRFILFTTYGLPVELSMEIAKEKGYTNFIQMEATLQGTSTLQAKLEAHKELSRTASAGKFKGGLADNSAKVTAFHTATHLMLAALRKELGDAVHQAGSNITEERTRFDFTYPSKVSREVLDAVEVYVNEAIAKGSTVTTTVMPKNEARETGVEGSFWEKYPDQVTVYQVVAPDGTIYSQELCGGPHVTHTGEIAAFGRFRIIKEEASSQGVRRVKAIFEESTGLTG